MIVCPCCKGKLDKKKSSNKFFLVCKNINCNLYRSKFPILRQRPVLIPFGFEYCIFKKSNNFININLGSQKRIIDSKKKKIRAYLQNIFYGRNIETLRNFERLYQLFNYKNKVLIIGGGTIGSGMEEFLNKCRHKEICFESIDVYFSDNLTAIADAHYLPYKDKSFDAVIIQAVLEHVINPQLVVKEIKRVLVNKGLVYAETPFLQSVHEGPFDFSRFTHSGQRWLFREFEEISSGAHQGAFSSSLFIFSYALSGLFRNPKIAILIRLIFTRLCAFLDKLVFCKYNIDIACGCYFLGQKKVNARKNNYWIVDYYKGSQLK